MVERIFLALLFALVSVGILMLSFKLMKLKYNHKYNLWASGIFALCLYLFSFFPSIILSILTAILVLAVLKYLYIRTWNETLKIWGIWLGSWIIILIIIALTISKESLL